MSCSRNSAEDEYATSVCDVGEENEAGDSRRGSQTFLFLVLTLSFTFALSVVLVIIGWYKFASFDILY